MNDQEKIKYLKEQVNELIEWQKAYSFNQVPFPMGIDTKELVKEGLLSVTGKTEASVTFDVSLEVEYDGKVYWLGAKLNS